MAPRLHNDRHQLFGIHGGDPCAPIKQFSIIESVGPYYCFNIGLGIMTCDFAFRSHDNQALS